MVENLIWEAELDFCKAHLGYTIIWTTTATYCILHTVTLQNIFEIPKCWAVKLVSFWELSNMAILTLEEERDILDLWRTRRGSCINMDFPCSIYLFQTSLHVHPLWSTVGVITELPPFRNIGLWSQILFIVGDSISVVKNGTGQLSYRKFVLF
jgi:hypothetical protein